MSHSRFEIIPAWRIARLRAALREVMQRGGNVTDTGEDLNHRALRRRFAVGRSRALSIAPSRRRRRTRKGGRFPEAKQIAIWRAILAFRPAQWRPGDKAPFGSIVRAHKMAMLACRELELAPPRYRTIYVLWHDGIPSAVVMQALLDHTH
jgi:hypothetical protein